MASLLQTRHNRVQSRDRSRAASKCATSPELMLASIPEGDPQLFTASDGEYDFGSSIEDFLRPQVLLTPNNTGSIIDNSYFHHAVSNLPSLASSTYFTPSSTENQSSSIGHSTGASGSDEGRQECPGCLKLGLETLRALCAASLSHMCLFDEASRQINQQPRNIDAVLSINREAMESISRILDCHCIVMPALQMVVTIICDKIIAWNKAMITPRKSSEPDGSSGSSSVGGQGLGLGLDLMYGGMGDEEEDEEEAEPKEKVASQSAVQIGSFSPDAALTERLIACAVFYELQKVEGLVEQLAGVNSSIAAGPALPFRKNTHRSLVDLLRRRLLAVKTAASRRLQGV